MNKLSFKSPIFEKEVKSCSTQSTGSHSPEVDISEIIDEEVIEGVYKVPLVSEFAVNHWYIILCICTFSVNGLCVAWTTGGYNQSASIFAAKLDWTGAEAQ